MDKRRVFAVLWMMVVITVIAFVAAPDGCRTDDLEEGEVCEGTEEECGPGLTCCYPCGVPGCESVCTPTCRETDPGCMDGCVAHP